MMMSIKQLILLDNKEYATCLGGTLILCSKMDLKTENKIVQGNQGQFSGCIQLFSL